MSKKIIALASIVCLTICHQLISNQQPQEDSMQRRFMYMCVPHGILFCVGTALLQETMSLRQPPAILTRMIALPVALTFMRVGARPFMSGTAYVRDIDSGKIPNPFSWKGFKQEGEASFKTAQNIFVKISKKLSEQASRLQNDKTDE